MTERGPGDAVLPRGRILEVRAGRARTRERPAWDRRGGATWRSAYLKEPLAGPARLGPLGLEADEQADRRVHGGPQQAVLAYSAAHYPRWRAELGIAELGPGGFAENLVVEGMDETTVCIGDVLAAGAVRLQVSQPRGPCMNIARRWDRRDLVERVTANGRTGWYLRVLAPGTLAAGTALEVLERPHPGLTVERAFRARVDADADPAALAALAACEALSPGWRSRLRAKLARGNPPGT